MRIQHSFIGGPVGNRVTLWYHELKRVCSLSGFDDVCDAMSLEEGSKGYTERDAKPLTPVE